MRWVLAGLVMVSLAFAQAVPADAVTLDFSQAVGFKSSTGTEAAIGGGAAVPGAGGLEFATAIVGPPGPPTGDGSDGNPPAPPDTWEYVGWGCKANAVSAANCANAGVIGNATNAPVPFGNANRSALQILGQFGALTDSGTGGFHGDGWVDITIVNHQNNIISGNAMSGVEIHSILRLGPDGVVLDVPAIHVLATGFTETANIQSNGNPPSVDCVVQPAPGAPINPFGSRCDDFFLVNGLNLDSILIPAGFFNPNDPDMLVDFRLDPRLGALVCDGTSGQAAACLGYPGPAIIVYTDESDLHGMAVQARLRVQLPNLTLVKSPKNATFNVGQQLSFTMVITNTGEGTAHILNLNDPLPTTGGLTWEVTSITPNGSGTCNIDAGQVLSCTFVDVLPQASRTVVVTTTNVGGAPQSSCTGNKLNNLATASTVGVPDATDTGDYICTPPTTLRTVTQGGWGSKPAGNNPGTILQNNFATVFTAPNYLTIGGGCGGAFTLKFTSAAAVRAFLPQGSTPKALTGSAINPITKNLTVFAGQVLALQINVSFSAAGVLSPGLGSFVLLSGPAAGKTVAEVLADANKALGGCGLPSYASSISILNDIVTSINEQFD